MQPLAIIALAGVATHALVDFPFQIESIQLLPSRRIWGFVGEAASGTTGQKSDVTVRRR